MAAICGKDLTSLIAPAVLLALAGATARPTAPKAAKPYNRWVLALRGNFPGDGSLVNVVVTGRADAWAVGPGSFR
jgi:hypothetical protein